MPNQCGPQSRPQFELRLQYNGLQCELRLQCNGRLRELRLQSNLQSMILQACVKVYKSMIYIIIWSVKILTQNVIKLAVKLVCLFLQLVRRMGWNMT